MSEIIVKNYTKKIANDVILDDINYTFRAGVVYGIKGKNGSGKTMLLRAISGLISSTSGYVEVDGKIIGKDCSFPPDIGILIEKPGFLDWLSGEENLYELSQIRKKIGKKEIDSILKTFGLYEERKKKYRKYSLGMKQKIGLCSAFMENPDIILLDEPTNALDEQAVNTLRAQIEVAKKRGAVIIVTSHDLDELNTVADEILVMKRGHLDADFVE